MSTYCKYYKQKKQVSYDSGTTWQDVVPYEYQKGDLYQQDSSDCEYLVITRWVAMSGANDYWCDGTTKKAKEKEQISNDGGITWTDTGDIRNGSTVIEYNSTDCGYVPQLKFKATYLGGSTYSATCDSNTTLTTATTRPSGYQYTAMTDAIIGDCVTTIANAGGWSKIGTFMYCYSLSSCTISSSVTTIEQFAFANCSGLTSLTIPNSVTSIGAAAFQYCYGFTNMNIPDSVTTIDASAFAWCSGLTSITIGSGITSIGEYFAQNTANLQSVTIKATTPPIADINAFSNSTLYTIYVPSESVNTYKQMWANYPNLVADRIQAIQT